MADTAEIDGLPQAEATQTAPEAKMVSVPIAKGGAPIEVDINQIPQHVWDEVVLQGLKAVLTRGMSKITKEAIPDETKRKAEAMTKAKANLDDMYAGKTKVSIGSNRRQREQLDTAYRHGGGWNPFNGFRLTASNCLVYHGDPPMAQIAMGKMRDETILMYEHAWVAIIQPDRSFEVCRMD